MPKGICVDGYSIDSKARSFQINKNSEDFLMIQQYYDDYFEHWYKKVEDLVEREEFRREWCSKLLHAINTYCEQKAIYICRTRGWSMNQKFNRWFYSALRNWISNIKTQAFRSKRRPGIVCPICLREVPKIEELHLRHIRTTKELPRVFEWNGEVYKTMLKPRKQARKYLCGLKEALKHPKSEQISVKWPWRISNRKGVVCPLTGNIIPEIVDIYLLKLPKRFRHYAKLYTWFQFQEEFPNYMVHSEVRSLDYQNAFSFQKDGAFVDYVRRDKRKTGGNFAPYTCFFGALRGSPPLEYEHTLMAIRKHVDDQTDREILMYMIVGYEPKDVCEELGISRNEFKERVGILKNNRVLERTLIKGIV